MKKFLLLLLLLPLLSSCDETERVKDRNIENAKSHKASIKASTYIGLDTSVKTVEYEGHKWIVFKGPYSLVVKHHPDCCDKALRDE